MKKNLKVGFFMTLVILIFGALPSCKDEPGNSPLVGTWLDREGYDGFISNVQLVFYSNGKFTRQYWENDEDPEEDKAEGTWSTSGKMLIIKIDDEDEEEHYEYEIVNDKLTLHSLDNNYSDETYIRIK